MERTAEKICFFEWLQELINLAISTTDDTSCFLDFSHLTSSSWYQSI
jgi:hypothetical protein